MWLRNLPWPSRSGLGGAIVYGLLNFGISYSLIYWALLSLPSGLTAVIFSTLPLVTLLIATLVGLERLGWRNIVGALVAVTGVTIIFFQPDFASVQVAPVVAIIAAVIISAIASVLVKRMTKPHPVTLNAIGMGVGTVFLLTSSWVAHEPKIIPTLSATWLALGWLTMSAIIAFLLFVWIVGRWTASAATYALVLAPLVTIMLGAWLINESFTINFLIGSVIALAGAYLGASRSRMKTRSADQAATFKRP
jgi:drug/metabolite transporter (DMT)-like permease